MGSSGPLNAFMLSSKVRWDSFVLVGLDLLRSIVSTVVRALHIWKDLYHTCQAGLCEACLVT